MSPEGIVEGRSERSSMTPLTSHCFRPNATNGLAGYFVIRILRCPNRWQVPSSDGRMFAFDRNARRSST